MKKFFIVVLIVSTLALMGLSQGLSLATFKKGLANFEQELAQKSETIGQKLTNIGQYQLLTLNSAKLVSHDGNTYIFGSVENKGNHTIVGGYLRLVFINQKYHEVSKTIVAYITPFVLRNEQKGYFCANVKGNYDSFLYASNYATSLLLTFVSTVYDFPYKISKIEAKPIFNSKDELVTFRISYTNTQNDTLTGVTTTIFGLNKDGKVSYVGQDIHYWNDVAPNETLSATITGVELSGTSFYGVIIQGIRTFTRK